MNFFTDDLQFSHTSGSRAASNLPMIEMKKFRSVLLGCAILSIQHALMLLVVSAHPGSGIVVDAQGQVFFQDAVARTIWKIDRQGKLTAYYDKLGGHWMALDVDGTFARSRLTLVERITPDDFKPAILVADGGAPIAVHSDGNLYYGLAVASTGKVTVGITKVSRDGKQEPFAPKFAETIEKLGVTGLASGHDGILYAACLTGVMKLRADGTFTTLINPVVVPDCDRDARTPFLRGLAVEERGMVYVAATGCRCLLRITPEGSVNVVLRSERPWSPTGVAVRNNSVYVLEYSHANGHVTEGWLPRVRKLEPDGTVTTLATISEAQQNAQPNRLNSK